MTYLRGDHVADSLPAGCARLLAVLSNGISTMVPFMRVNRGLAGPIGRSQCSRPETGVPAVA